MAQGLGIRHGGRVRKCGTLESKQPFKGTSLTHLHFATPQILSQGDVVPGESGSVIFQAHKYVEFYMKYPHIQMLVSVSNVKPCGSNETHLWSIRKQPLDQIPTSSVDIKMLLKMMDVEMLSFINTYDKGHVFLKRKGISLIDSQQVPTRRVHY